MNKIILPLTLLILSCATGNNARREMASVCKDLSIPREAFVQSQDVINHRQEKYIPSRNYDALVDHAIDLRICGQAQSCVIEWAEYERDCSLQKTFLDSALGLSCKLEKPSCKVERVKR